MVADTSPSEEGSWIREQRQQVEGYLRRRQCAHRGVAEYPAFCLHPYLAVWAVQSMKYPGAVGWWAISGDVPTDYIGSAEIANPRDALRAFACQWTETAACMLRDEEPPNANLGPPERRLELGELLQCRAGLLRDFAENPNLWDPAGEFLGWDD